MAQEGAPFPRDPESKICRGHAVETPRAEIVSITELGSTADDDRRLGDFLSWALLGDAFELYDGNELKPSLEAWMLLARRAEPQTDLGELTNSMRIHKPDRVAKLQDAIRAVDSRENRCTDYKRRNGTSAMDDEGLRK